MINNSTPSICATLESIYIETAYQLKTTIINEESFKKTLKTILNSEIIDLSEIYKYCHSSSQLRNPNNIEIIRSIFNSIDFELEFTLQQLYSKEYNRIVMEKMGSSKEATLVGEQLKTATINRLVLDEIAVSLKKDNQYEKRTL